MHRSSVAVAALIPDLRVYQRLCIQHLENFLVEEPTLLELHRVHGVLLVVFIHLVYYMS